MNTVAILGFGNVGRALAFRLLEKHYQVDHIVIIDPEPSIVGAYIDMHHAAQLQDCSLSINDMDKFAEADFIFHCAGASVPATGDRMHVAAENARITEMIFNHYKTKDTARIIVISNPVDLITYFAQKASGLPSKNVVGTGTLLDTMRLNAMLKQKYFPKPKGLILGEHGSTMFISNSYSRTNGKLLTEAMTAEEISSVMEEVKNAAKTIKKTQEATIYGVVEAALHIYLALMNDHDALMPVSCTTVFSENGVNHEVCISQLCKVNKFGVQPLSMELDSHDKEMYLSSLKTIKQVITSIA